MKLQTRPLDKIEKVILTYFIGLFLAIVAGIPITLYFQTTIGMANDQKNSGKSIRLSVSCLLPGYTIDPSKFLKKIPPKE